MAASISRACTASVWASLVQAKREIRAGTPPERTISSAIASYRESNPENFSSQESFSGQESFSSQENISGQRETLVETIIAGILQTNAPKYQIIKRSLLVLRIPYFHCSSQRGPVTGPKLGILDL